MAAGHWSDSSGIYRMWWGRVLTSPHSAEALGLVADIISRLWLLTGCVHLKPILQPCLGAVVTAIELASATTEKQTRRPVNRLVGIPDSRGAPSWTNAGPAY